MTRKIFNSILFTAITVLLSGLIIFSGMMYRYFENLERAQLQDYLFLASKGVEQLGKEYLEQLEMTHYRLTLVRSDGTVTYDNYADPSSLENHNDREEIMEAALSGTGSSKRQSTTLTKNTIYEAVRLKNGDILRISTSHATALALMLDMSAPFFLILLIAIILSALFAHRMSSRIVKPLNNLNLEKPMENEAYEELSPLLYRIHEQQKKIKDHIESLTKKQKEFDQITSQMKEALILLDHQGKILTINPAAKAVFSINGPCVGEDFLSLERKQSMRKAFQKAKLDGHAEFEGKRKGRYYHFELSSVSDCDTDYGMVILAFDITEQRNAEKNRREFTANVSHELKTPLQSILGSAELLEHGIVKQEDIPRFVGRIRKEADRLLLLINHILHLSKLDEGGAMPTEDIPLLSLSNEVIDNLHSSAVQHFVSLEACGEELSFHGVRHLLYELIYNLCENAIKYNREGGSVSILVYREENNACIRVSDTGIGIPSKHHQKVFERFYRVDKSHSRQSGGTGLGLSIVKHIVQYHNGRILLESEENKGTVITVTLPI